jgi:hypothetical protein
MHFLKIALVAATVLGGASLVGSTASATPVNGLAALPNGPSTSVQNVVWVCSSFGCVWRSRYWGIYQGPFVWSPRWLYPRYYRGPRNYWIFPW